MDSVISFTIIGLILQGIFYGVYCVIFCLYLRIQFKRRTDQWKCHCLAVYAVIANFILCTAFFALDIAHGLVLLKWHLEAERASLWFSSIDYLSNTEDVLYTCIDFISQGILIYRCWIVWRRPSIVVVPIILSLAFLVTALTTFVFIVRAPGHDTATAETPSWCDSAIVSFFSMSLAVNTLVTGLIVFKILNVYRDSQVFENPSHTTRAVCTYGQGPRDLHLIVSILVESGMITLVMQLAQTILYKVYNTAFPVAFGIVVMLYGISMTIVLVRVQMAVNYDNETSRIALTSRVPRFAPFDSNNQIIHITGNGLDSDSEMKVVGDV